MNEGQPLRKQALLKSVVTGNGVSQDISYHYRWTTKSALGLYEVNKLLFRASETSHQCCVHKSFLDSASNTFCSEDFYFDSSTWAFQLVHHEDGMLGVYVCSRNDFPVTLHRSSILINQSNEAFSVMKACRSCIRPRECRGHGLVPVETIRDANSGFLGEDYFYIRLEMRCSLPENESISFCRSGNSMSIFWKLRDLHNNLNPRFIWSESFQLGGHLWYLQLVPTGVTPSKKMSLYLTNENRDKVEAELRVDVVNNNSKQDDFFKKAVYSFDARHSGLGFAEFLSIEGVEDEELGFLRNGWVTMVVHVTVSDTVIRSGVKSIKKKPSHIKSGPKCIMCLANNQTTSMIHGTTIHPCVCHDCGTILEWQLKSEGLRCPICSEIVDRILFE